MSEASLYLNALLALLKRAEKAKPVEARDLETVESMPGRFDGAVVGEVQDFLARYVAEAGRNKEILEVRQTQAGAYARALRREYQEQL